MNLPNKITIVRVIMIPIFLFFMLMPQIPANRYIAVGIFIVASITDAIDGYLARKNNLITNFGKFMDPLADKLLVSSALICFVGMNQIPIWIAFAIIAREFIISGFRLVASDKGVVISAGLWGKLKTNVQMIMSILLIIDFDIVAFNILEQVLIYLALAFTIISLVDYMVKNKDVLKESHN